MAEKKADTGDAIAGESLADRARRMSAIRATKSNVDTLTKEKFGSMAGKGVGAAEKGYVGAEPKMEQGESPAAFAARRRKYLDMKSEAKEKALGGK